MAGFTAAEAYGGPRTGAAAPPVVPAPSASPPTADGPRLDDPHDPVDRGPADWFEDPVIWLVLVAALATGVLGLRFKWFGSGAEVGARVDLGDQFATLVGTTLYAITGIVLFKVAASKVDIPGLQKLAAAI